MSELICCRRCDEPTCHGCNLCTLANALTLGQFDGLMDEYHTVHINADVVERKYGKLLTNEFGYESCSVCNYGLMLFITDENNILRKPNYCPNCGAKLENIDDV